MPERVLGIGGIVIRNDAVLLVRHTYGPTRDRWDFPRGHVQVGEGLEGAVVREVREETSIEAAAVGIIAVRHVAMSEADGSADDTLIIWLLDYVAGDPIPDGQEISEAKFWPVTDAFGSTVVSSWAKEIVRVGTHSVIFTRNAYRPGAFAATQTDWRLYTA